jgi:hypothetical protein
MYLLIRRRIFYTIEEAKSKEENTELERLCQKQDQTLLDSLSYFFTFLLDDERDEEERLALEEAEDLLREGEEDLLGVETLLFTDVLDLEEV